MAFSLRKALMAATIATSLSSTAMAQQEVENQDQDLQNRNTETVLGGSMYLKGNLIIIGNDTITEGRQLRLTKDKIEKICRNSNKKLNLKDFVLGGKFAETNVYLDGKTNILFYTKNKDNLYCFNSNDIEPGNPKDKDYLQAVKGIIDTHNRALIAPKL